MTTSPTSSLRYFSYLKRAGAWLHDQFYRHFAIFFIIMLVALVSNEIYIFGMEIYRWDALLVSGGLTFIVGLRLALNVPLKVDEALLRLINRGAVQLDPSQLPALKSKLEAQTERYAQWYGLFIGAAVFIGFLSVFRLKTQIPLTILESLGGYIVGQFLGRAVSYGRLGTFLKDEGIVLQIQPGHLDGAAGFKPIGDLYFFQAMLIAIPATYLAIWWLIIPLWSPRYDRWHEVYVGLLAIVLIVEFLAFLLPIWSFHTEMQKQKDELLKDADSLSHSIVELQARLVNAQSDQERGQLKERLALMTERYWAIEQMPTWPVDVRVQRKFTVSNVGLFLPLLIRFLSTKTGTDQTIWGDIGKLFISLFQ